MKKEQSIALKTMAIKAKLANLIRKELYQYSDNKYEIAYKNKKDIKHIDLKEFFDKLYPVAKEMHTLLNKYKEKRKKIKQRDTLREQNGWKPKIKTKINLVESK
jgi:hypothetical protein